LADAERVFRIDRIRSAGETNETFTPPTTPPPPEVRYTPGVDDVTAVIRLHPGAEWVTEYYPVEILKQDADGTVIEFRAADPLVAARLLVRLGEQADLVTGQAVATACDRLRYDILTRYGVTKP
jgi:proteasome accessory factor C